MCICNVLKHKEFLRRLQKSPYSKIKNVLKLASEDEIKALVEVLTNNSELNLGTDKRRLISKKKAFFKFFQNKKWLSLSKLKSHLVAEKTALKVILSVVIEKLLEDEILEACLS
jgi:hypothetical protein